MATTLEIRYMSKDCTLRFIAAMVRGNDLEDACRLQLLVRIKPILGLRAHRVQGYQKTTVSDFSYRKKRGN